ncbi:MAG: hypothetical protein GAK44_00065 [Pseudomonas delhiensis]|nr:MAG: hypothetical protein GAK44_00065 [Pseudomonas delhiensis]
MSTRGLAELHGDNAASHTQVLRGILQVVALYIRCLRNLPAVDAVFHECIDATTFEAIGARLGLDLSSAQAYYDRARVRNYTLEDFPEAERAFAREVIEVHEALREQVTQGVRLAQLEQNSNHLSPTHFTALGDLYRRVEKLLAER